MSSVNKVILIGRLGKDPETKYMTNGEAVTNFSIATSETWKDKSGEKQEKTEWHNITAYRKLAEIIAQYVKKGALIYIEGKLQTRKYQTKEGQDRYTTEIIVNEMQMLSSRQQGGDHEQAEPSRPAQAPKPERQQQPQGSAPAKGAFDNFDDDIPFMWHGAPGSGVSWRAM